MHVSIHPTRVLHSIQFRRSDPPVPKHANIMHSTGLANLESLPVSRRRRARHHSQTSWVHAKGVLLGLLLLSRGLSRLAILLLLALALLRLDLGALFAVADALLAELVVLCDDLGFADFAVATAAGTGGSVSMYLCV